MINYCFVLDSTGKPLSPTKENKGWYLIRKGKARLVDKYPMIIQLNREVSDVDTSTFTLGIDDGSKHVGIGLVQNGLSKQKAVFKGTIEHRWNVKDLMNTRSSYRRYRRSHKRYRKARFNNRASSKREGRIAPSIKQKKDAILRVVNKLIKWIPINNIVLEDVLIDIRALQEGEKLYGIEYKKSNKLNENIRLATLIRDNFECKMCKSSGCKLEVHHITPKRFNGADTLSNLITLCNICHKGLGKDELEYAEYFYKIVKGKNVRFDYAQHVMQGKNYLRKELLKLAPVSLTYGSETSNNRIAYRIDKTHSNDALVIAGIMNNNIELKDYIIKPMRKKSKAKLDSLNGFKHRDLVKYTKRNGDFYIGWITALLPIKNQCSITTLDGKVLKRYGIKPLKLIWRFNNIYWISK